jgi:hypothetical protein
MFIVQTGYTKQAKKYCITMDVLFVLLGALGALLTMHIYVRPPDRPSQP